MSIQQSKVDNQIHEASTELLAELIPYPIDMSSFLTLLQGTLNASEGPNQANPTACSPIAIAQYALAHWNEYLATRDEQHRAVFLTQARWFVEYEVRIGEDSGGWPLSLPHPDVLPIEPADPQGRSDSSVAGSHFQIHTRGAWLSALAQGSALSVLLRAYQLTREEVFLEVAHRAVRTFERDILDGGVAAPVGEDGIFFEEVAVYPAAHTLNGFIFALFGLYDYIALTDAPKIRELMKRSLATMHRLLAEFDLGFWTCPDLLQRHLASPSQLSQQTALLEALATVSECEYCAEIASRWKGYRWGFGSRMRYHFANRCASYGRTIVNRIRSVLFPKPRISPPLRVCVPLNALFFTGGILTVLLGIDQVTDDIWQIEYLTRDPGWDEDGFVVHQFGTQRMDPWHFPTVWVYALNASWKLFSLMRRGASYHVILPQDGVFSAAFTGLIARLAGARVVCIDHANLTLIKNRNYRQERMGTLARKKWPMRLLGRFLYAWYWPSLYSLAWIAARCVDHYFIPGVVGDGVEDICQQLGVPPSRITRFNSMINIERHALLDAASRASMRERKGLDADAIVVAMACRLVPEKGVAVAVESIGHVLQKVSPDVGSRLRFIIAGDGWIRKQVEEVIQQHGLSQTCLLWGDISSEDVLSLLSISDIFLSTTTRGTCFPMAILEAMASGCAVIASKEPIGNAHLLAEGRGIAVDAGDAIQTSEALVRLVNDLGLSRQMGRAARDYIATRHSPTQFRRNLQRVTCWSALDEIIGIAKKSETVERERENEQWN